MSTAELAAIVAAVTMGLIMCFQLLLASGAPFGEASWGGRHHGSLPAKLRWASLASAGVLGACSWVVLARADLMAPGSQPIAIRLTTWVFAGFMALNTLGNLASKSRIERAIMTPLTAITCGCFTLVAWS